jgi:hypothetical protein
MVVGEQRENVKRLLCSLLMKNLILQTGQVIAQYSKKMNKGVKCERNIYFP